MDATSFSRRNFWLKKAHSLAHVKTSIFGAMIIPEREVLEPHSFPERRVVGLLSFAQYGATKCSDFLMSDAGAKRRPELRGPTAILFHIARCLERSYSKTLLGPATTQNLVVKFDGEICAGVLVEHASDDFPQEKKLENLLPNFAGSSPPILPKTSPTSLWKSLVLTLSCCFFVMEYRAIIVRYVAQWGFAQMCPCVKPSSKGGFAPFWDSANLP